MKNYNLRCLQWELVTYGNRRNLKDYYFLLSLQTLLPYWAIFERPWDIFGKNTQYLANIGDI